MPNQFTVQSAGMSATNIKHLATGLHSQNRRPVTCNLQLVLY